MADERRGLLRKFGTRIYRPKRPGQPWARITALGSYREVGRAMHLVTTRYSLTLVPSQLSTRMRFNPSSTLLNYSLWTT